ncbi:F-box/RNI-like superfamily protein [Striga asiatica]|uniref:F-box/RNI-like superfamily protein n=1 Tax=Striga asiatica TaxID=4170 RepID=A0A5A7QVC8_STRAF|nr:F-box/RNI-like superfamily protein [Striga asiatica]
MEKKKQAAETEEIPSTAMDDTISQVPIHILHHILCFLSQKEAVRTCLLSKQWRHMGTTRPNLDFFEEWFDNTQENFVSVVDRTLQGYSDQNLSIHKLHLHLSRVSRPVISLLDKWISMIPALKIKSFKFNIRSSSPAYYDLPSAVFLAESLEELHLCQCKLSPVESVRFKRLRSLTLEQVQVDDGTLENIISGCLLLMRLVLKECQELRNVRLSEVASPGLNHFELNNCQWIEGRSIEIDVPNIEMVSIVGLWIWSQCQSTFFLSRLTSLHLCAVILSSESFDLLSFGCPTLASLTLINCSGFEEFHLASDSVKFLRISTCEKFLKGVTISAPNILSFTFIAGIPQAPDTFSFTTNSRFWYSKVILSSYKHNPDLTWWFLKLRRVLKALSGSQIDLTLQMNSGSHLDMPCRAVDGSRLLSEEPPMMLMNLEFTTSKCHTESWYSDFTNDLFRVCRPSHVWDCRLVGRSARNHRLSEFQFNILLANMSLRTETYFWRHDLEQVHVNTVDGQLVQWTDLSELRNRAYDELICLKLKWRDQKTA